MVKGYLNRTLVEECGDKHFTRRIKRDETLMTFLDQFFGDSISEKVYNMVHIGENICSRGNARKFVSINKGYCNCGPAKVCPCTKEQVSNSVSSTMQQFTEEEIAASNAKRVETSMKLYGVSNNGQTQQAKEKHAEFYSDEVKVAESIQKGKQTRLELYGDENYNKKNTL